MSVTAKTARLNAGQNNLMGDRLREHMVNLRKLKCTEAGFHPAMDAA
jgi:hypothetical protein